MKIIIFIFITLVSLFSIATPSFSWDGYDYDKKTEISIGPGNLVREGNIIQFYDVKDDITYNAKVLLMQEDFLGTSLQLENLDNSEERNVTMY